ncbi:unnamed protein product [Peronospora farinosa]|uniref:Uncharacterized protein n=1 Tax=Peronospora farinosa TaxID=134698 RepID=A0AAV0SZM8_9STRA|nr:unnamed protein product [Peronospora farinosa]CAI5709858.1 unnamed protein product [Peronospora farinosa]
METSIQVAPSSIKIQHESYVERRTRSLTVYPYEDCSSDVVKQLKLRERTTSSASSINSSKTSESLLGGDMETPVDVKEEESEGFVRERKSVETNVQSFKLQSHLRDMQRRMEILQGLILQATEQGSVCLRSKGSTLQANPCLVLMETMAKSDNKAQLAESQTSVAKESVDESLGLAATLPRMCAERMQNDEMTGSRDGKTDSNLTSYDEKNPFAITALVHCIKALQVQLKEATDENKQLLSTVQKLEQENAHLQAQTAFHTPVRDKDDSGSIGLQSNLEPKAVVVNEKIGNNNDRSLSRLATAIFGVPSAFQRVMEEDLKILKDHARCQYKLHELWDSVRQLKILVETYDITRNDMRVQRDDAIAEAERADVENIRLVSCNNPQQKIKYLQQLKKDNEALRRKNRALNERIVKEALKLFWVKNGCSLHEDGDLRLETVDSALLGDTLQEFEEPSVRTDKEILRRLWNFSRKFEQRLERLRLARKSLLQGDDDSMESEGQLSIRSEPLPMTW